MTQIEMDNLSPTSTMAKERRQDTDETDAPLEANNNALALWSWTTAALPVFSVQRLQR
jgi:hypothetical protein